MQGGLQVYSMGTICQTPAPLMLKLGKLTRSVTDAESGTHLFAIFGLDRLQLLHKLFDLSSNFISPAPKL